MNRRFAVLGLAVAMCGTGVAGQTAQKDAPVNPELLQQDGPVNPELLHQDVPVLLPASGDQTPAKPGGAFANTYPVLKPTGSQTQPATTAPVAITPAPGGFSNAYPRPTQAQTGIITFRVESVGPQRTRIYLTRNGVDAGTFESTGFTVTTGTSETSISASGPVSITVDGKMFTVDGFTMRIGLGGTFSIDGHTWTYSPKGT